MISPVATLPVRDGNAKVIVPVPPVSIYAFPPGVGEGGTSAQRPVDPPHRTPYYDADLQELIYYSRDRTRWENFRGDARIALPVNTLAPAVTGTATVGQVLTTTLGTWTGDPTITYARQWKRDGVAISGATGATYTLVADDATKKVKCTVTATNGGGSVSVDSNETAAVAAG